MYSLVLISIIVSLKIMLMKKIYFSGVVACAIVSIFCVLFFGLRMVTPIEGSDANVWGMRWLMFCCVVAAGFYGVWCRNLYKRLQEPW